MKKFLVWLLMSILLLSACSSENTTPNKPNNTTIDDQIVDSDSNSKNLSDLIEAFDRSATIQETILFDERQIKISATNLSFSATDVNLAVTIQNNSAKKLNFSCGSASCDVNSINGIMAADGFLSCEVQVGEKVDEIISFDIGELIANGFSNVANIEIGFWVSSDDYDNFYTGVLGVNTSANDGFDYSKNTYQELTNSKEFGEIFDCNILYFSNDLLYESTDSTIRVLSVSIIENTNGDVQALFEIENNSDAKIQAWGKETHINGELIKSYSSWIESINAKRRLIASFPLSSYAEEYSGDIDVSVLKEFSFILSSGENSNIANDSGKITVTTDDLSIILIK